MWAAASLSCLSRRERRPQDGHKPSVSRRIYSGPLGFEVASRPVLDYHCGGTEIVSRQYRTLGKMRMQDHPGFFGMTSKGVIHIHADWPVYPEEHGANLVLFWLTAFPNGTAFKSIDDIDRCSLFLADVKYSNRANQSDERNFHVAVWHDDLLSLRKKRVRRWRFTGK